MSNKLTDKPNNLPLLHMHTMGKQTKKLRQTKHCTLAMHTCMHRASINHCPKCLVQKLEHSIQCAFYTAANHDFLKSSTLKYQSPTQLHQVVYNQRHLTPSHLHTCTHLLEIFKGKVPRQLDCSAIKSSEKRGQDTRTQRECIEQYMEKYLYVMT